MKSTIKSILPQSRGAIIIWISAIVLAFVLGLMLAGDKTEPGTQHSHGTESVAEAQTWTCSMHPNIQQPKPGKCPICGMDLIPVKASSGDERGGRHITLSENARKLATVEVAPVERKSVSREIRLVGKIEMDETRVSVIAARFPGRIEKLFVNYTGSTVGKNYPLVELYSPEILATQLEFTESLKAANSFSGDAAPELLLAAHQQFKSVKDRLRLWGLTDQQLTEMERSKVAAENITLYSPIQGVVIEKQAIEGKYVSEGAPIYTIADLSEVWLNMAAYESDLLWLRTGQNVEFQTEAFPGKSFEGKIVFIDPVIDPKTRTATVRVNVKNSAGTLKPEMLAHAIVKSELKSGKVGKPLVIPASAPLITGKRAIVYVQDPKNDGSYEGREITLGPRAGDYYVVESGLEEGERVVVKGNFKIDSAIQILGRTSMMNPENESRAASKKNVDLDKPSAEEIPDFSDIPDSFKKQLDDVYAAYFEIQFALSRDSFEESAKNATAFLRTLKKVDMKLLGENSHIEWMKSLTELKTSASQISKSGDIEEARKFFEPLSNELIRVAKIFGSDNLRLLVYHCPMAFDFKGADWLQNKPGTENPYFGSAMFSCGDQTADLTSPKSESIKGEHHNE